MSHRQRSWSEFHNTLFPDPTFPPRPYEIDIAGYLYERGYHVTSTRAVLMWAEDFGTVEGCRELMFDDNDSRHVESLIPEQPVGNWSRPEYAGTWTVAEVGP